MSYILIAIDAEEEGLSSNIVAKSDDRSFLETEMKEWALETINSLYEESEAERPLTLEDIKDVSSIRFDDGGLYCDDQLVLPLKSAFIEDFEVSIESDRISIDSQDANARK